MEPPNLNDLEFPSLQQLLREYVEAGRQATLGLADPSSVERKLDKLTVSCRAADRLLALIAKPQLARMRAYVAPKDN